MLQICRFRDKRPFRLIHLPSSELAGSPASPAAERWVLLHSGARKGGMSGTGGRRRGAAGRSHANSQRAPSENGTTNGENGGIGVPPWQGGNRVLASLPPDELSALGPSLSSVTLKTGTILYKQRAAIDSVYFPDTCVISLLSPMDNGSVVEVGTIGNEGIVGLGLFLGATVSVPETLAQIPGDSRCMSATDFLSAVRKLPRFRDMVARCTHAFMTQVAQTAACNRLHGIEQRCARWSLLTHDRVGGGDSFPLTHQFLSFMLRARRAGVTEALGDLTHSALIEPRSRHT